MFPSVEGLLPKQVEILHKMVQQIADCEDNLPMEHWCRPCTNKYMRVLELVHRWRKMGTYFAKGRWWCNYMHVPKFTTDTRYTFHCSAEDDKSGLTTFFNLGGAKD